eukprot:Blabericola_migrator_1__3982@NODE_2207_length_3123_cov_159_187173_g1390_i0_p1_GENE_NODE_2207_length_3123_cov_159_187173_g1390_i0NODE_2207_length_3123_cov_159_187173_g1390_i0_p1_ORF_typecomplete_len948_score119_97PigN/PF04987_14/1_3e74Phosphodiest/PF01663_22/3_1e22Phosphodiest/PF01663_22/2_2e03Sulfatase/PF00884_23/6_8e09_NODE_2207_length_3123_cov_159_187173_g1390_i01132956
MCATRWSLGAARACYQDKSPAPFGLGVMTYKAHLGWVIFLVTSSAIHLTFLPSVFDAYFRTHLHTGMAPTPTTDHPPADRVVVFIADGLRAEAYFDPVRQEIRDKLPGGDSPWAAPFLKQIAEFRGLEAVLHTRAPTETRPCFQSMFAGFYEDPSAVMKAFKNTPVMFDTIFNHSTTTWMFAPASTAHIFGSSMNPNHTQFIFHTTEASEDYSRGGRTYDESIEVLLRHNLLDKLRSRDSDVVKTLGDERVVILIHLLGVDISGHGRGPRSFDYYDALRFDDQLVQMVYSRLENFFNYDGRTAYIFTGDHGMSDRGTHGDNDPQCVKTPYIAWGAGIAHRPKDTDPKDWDIDQNSMAPFIATLLGAEVPSNSAGWPQANHFANPAIAAAAQKAAALTHLEHYRLVNEKMSKSKAIFFPFDRLTSRGNDDVDSDQSPKTLKAKLIDLTDTEEVSKLSKYVFDLSEQGLTYLRAYDKFVITVCFILTLVGWMAYTCIFVSSETVSVRYALVGTRKKMHLNWVALLLVSCVLICTRLQSYTPLRMSYTVIPILLWWRVFADINISGEVIARLLQSPWNVLKRPAKYVAFTVAVSAWIGLLYRHRALVAPSFVALGLHPLLLFKRQGTALTQHHRNVLATWLMLCLCCAPFCLLSPPVVENYGWLRIEAVAISATCYFMSRRQKAHNLSDKTSSPAYQKRLRLIITATVYSMVVTHVNMRSLEKRQSLPTLNRVAGYVALLVPPLLSIGLHETTSLSEVLRLTLLSFTGPFYLLNMAYESMFFLFFCGLLVVWLELEKLIHTPPASPPGKARVQLHHMRIAYIAIFLVNASFFSTGNIASIASFNLKAVLRLEPVLSMTAMTGVLVFRASLPFIAIGLTLMCISKEIKLGFLHLGALSQTVTDVMAIISFYQVTDSGSWADIGESLTRFVIGSILGLLLIAAQLVGRVYTL